MAAPTASASAAVNAAATENVEVRTSPSERIPELIATLQGWALEIKDVISVLKAVQKENAKLQKAVNKRKARSAPASDGEDGAASQRRRVTPSGFTKPVKLSDALCAFMGVEPGTALPRTSVTKFINEYIKTNNLQNPANKRHIIPDARLKSILDLSGREDAEVTYFNMQTFIKHHFTKADE